ncbi:MAG: hypothetical protein WKF41_11140 [Gaiellaceae bacterium]
MRSLLLLAAVAALVPTALAGSVRSVTAPAPVLAVAFDGSRVAYAAGRSTTDCNRVFVWNLATRGVSKLGRKTHCEETSTGNAVAAVSIAGKRVLWVHYVGGNLRDWTLWTATTTAPAPIRIRLVTREADAPAPIVIGDGGGAQSGNILPYGVDRTVVALRPSGARQFRWTAPAKVVALSASGARLAVAIEGGRVIVLDGNGRILRSETFARTVEAVKLTPNALLVQSGRTLEVRDDGGIRSYSLLAGIRLADATSESAILVGGGKVLRLELDSSRGGVFANGTLTALADERVVVATSRSVTLRALP